MHHHVIVLLLFLAAAPAAAQRAVTVIGPNPGDVDAPTVLATSAGMLGGAAAASDTVVGDYTNVSLADVVQLVGCSAVELRCLDELAVTLEAEVLVFGELARTDDGAVLELSLFELGSAVLPTPSVITLPSVGVQEHVAARTKAFLDGEAIVRIDADAPGELIVGDRVIGAVPATVTLSPGTYDLRIIFEDGHESVTQVEVDSPGEFAFELAVPRGRAAHNAGATPESVASSGVRPARIAGWSCVALAAGSFGIAAYHGSEVASAQERFDATPYQSEAYAIANNGRRSARRSNSFIAVGVGFAAVGVVALLLDRPANDHSADLGPSWALSPTEGGALGVVRWTR